MASSSIVLAFVMIAIILGAGAAVIGLRQVSFTNVSNYPPDCSPGAFFNHLGIASTCASTPFLRTFGQGGFANLETLSDGKTYLKATEYLAALSPPNLYTEGVISGLTNSLIAYYPFDESSGTTTADLSPNQNTGTLTCNGAGCSNPTFVTGQYGKGLSFTATGTQASIVSIPSTVANNIDTYTVCLWFKTNGAQQSTATLIEKWSGAGGYPYSIRLFTGLLAFRAFDGVNNPSANSPVSTYGDGNWHLVCGVRIAQTSLTLYVDNAAAVTVTDTTGAGSETNASPVGVGDRPTVATVGCLCTIDDVEIYNVAMTSNQYTQKYNYGLQYAANTPVSNTPTPILVESGIQATLPNLINASVSGTTISWSAKWTAASVTSGYDIYPIGAEDAPGFANGVIIFWNGAVGAWQCQSNGGGAGTVVTITTPTANTIHAFKIVFTTAGSQVDFFIDGVNVVTINSNVPTGQLSAFIELSNIGTTNNLAQLWGFGGGF